MVQASRNLNAFAVRLGKDYKPMLAVDQAKKRLAEDQKYQQEQLQKAKEESAKALEKSWKLDKNGLSDQMQQFANRESQRLIEENTKMYKESNGVLSTDQRLEMAKRKEQVQDNINLAKTYDKELKAIGDNVMKNKDLFNVEEVSYYIQQSKSKAFNPDGSLNEDFDIQEVINGVNNAQFLNSSAVAERFADTVEGFELTDIDGLQKRKVKGKFAKWDSDKNEFMKDANGNVIVDINPQTVSLAKKDKYMKTLMDDYVAMENQRGNEATYMDALKHILKNQQVHDVPHANQKNPPASSGRRINPNDFTFSKSDDIKSELEVSDQNDMVGVESQFMDVTALELEDITLRQKNEDGSETPIRGDVNRFAINSQGQPIVELVRKDKFADSGVAVEILPFNESNYKAIRNLANEEARPVIDKAFRELQSKTNRKLYFNPAVKDELVVSIGALLTKSEKNTLGGDARTDEEIKDQLVSALRAQSLNFEEDQLQVDSSNFGGTENDIIYNGESYNLDNLNQLVNVIANQNKGNKRFLVDEQRYNDYQPTQSSEPSTGGVY